MTNTMPVQDALDFQAEHPFSVVIIDGETATVSCDAQRPVIVLPMNIARKMLRRKKYLQAVEDAVAQLGAEAQDDFEFAPEVHSDNVLVNNVLGKLGLSESQIYQLFIDAKSIF